MWGACAARREPLCAAPAAAAAAACHGAPELCHALCHHPLSHANHSCAVPAGYAAPGYPGHPMPGYGAPVAMGVGAAAAVMVGGAMAAASMHHHKHKGFKGGKFKKMKGFGKCVARPDRTAPLPCCLAPAALLPARLPAAAPPRNTTRLLPRCCCWCVCCCCCCRFKGMKFGKGMKMKFKKW